jgi:hypothetical protein
MHWFWRAAIAVGVTGLVAVVVELFGLPWKALARQAGDALNELAPSYRSRVHRPLDVIDRILAVVLPLAAIAVAVFLGLSRQMRPREGGETRCRRCGYILRGISEPRCPECGERI